MSLEKLMFEELDSKLNIRPRNSYKENIETIDSIIDGEYETVFQVLENTDPRVGHELFRYPEEQQPLKDERLEEIKDVLEKNSDRQYSWFDKTLFNLGYTKRAYPKLGDIYQNPRINHMNDMASLPSLTSYGDGKRKKDADVHYVWSLTFLAEELGDQDLEVYRI